MILPHVGYARRVGASIAVAALAAIVASVAAAGCEVLVPNDVATPSCTMTPFVDPGNGTCPKGMYCYGAGCKACESKDTCDGYDNDCDGIIDDGPSSDADGDGYTKCGKGLDATGNVRDRDCDDTNKAIFPGATEVCNGKDDNCDYIIDNPNLVCPVGEVCQSTLEKCISNAQACVPCSATVTTSCCQGPDNVCDQGTQKCVPNGTVDAGSTCSGDKACATGICSDPSELGQGPAVTTCTSPCCTSADCAADAVCWGGGTGGNYCVPVSSLSRTLGSNAPGASCSVGSDCRSGVCTASKCEDTCCSNANCTNGTSCAATSFVENGSSGIETLACVTPTGSTATNQSCTSNTQCASGFCACYSTNNSDDCHPSPNRSAAQFCAPPCCSSRQCPLLTTGEFAGNQFICNDDFLPPLQTGSVLPVCDGVQSQGTNQNGQVGDTCSTFTDCFSNLCGVPGALTSCTDVCCVDSDCGKAGWVCRPTPTGTGTFLRCVPQPT